MRYKLAKTKTACKQAEISFLKIYVVEKQCKILYNYNYVSKLRIQ